MEKKDLRDNFRKIYILLKIEAWRAVGGEQAECTLQFDLDEFDKSTSIVKHRITCILSDVGLPDTTVEEDLKLISEALGMGMSIKANEDKSEGIKITALYREEGFLDYLPVNRQYGIAVVLDNLETVVVNFCPQVMWHGYTATLLAEKIIEGINAKKHRYDTPTPGQLKEALWELFKEERMSVDIPAWGLYLVARPIVNM